MKGLEEILIWICTIAFRSTGFFSVLQLNDPQRLRQMGFQAIDEKKWNKSHSLFRSR
jgi:hypothetical protein